MKPKIEAKPFGSITIVDCMIWNDVILSSNGEIKKRMKRLSK